VTRPVPAPDDRSAPYWQAAVEHTLTLARCGRCAEFAMPPDAVCPHCGSTEPAFVFTPVEGSGVIRSWTVVRQSFLPGFDADLPFVLVDVELTEQPRIRLIGRLLDGVDAPLTVGTPVRVAFEDIADGVCVPAFELAS
jgi:uncharacterized OB-fold protein